MEVREAAPVVVGGMVLDIHAIPTSVRASPGTSTPGKVYYMLGGVARNVADCLSKLGMMPFLISIVGRDIAGNMLLENWRATDLSTEGILDCEKVETGVVCSIFDDKGELAAAVASVDAIEMFLTTEWIQKFSSTICFAHILMVDANLNSPSLQVACHMATDSGVPVWFEPVSVSKSRRIISVVKYVNFTSPNVDELVAMGNVLCHGNGTLNGIQSSEIVKRSVKSIFQMLRPAIWVLLEHGIEVVIVTLGSRGIFLCLNGTSCCKLNVKKTSSSIHGRWLFGTVSLKCPAGLCCSIVNNKPFAVHFPTLPASVVRLTGAGDCFVGGTLASLSAGLDIFQSVAVGVAAAKAVVETPANVPSAFDFVQLAIDAEKVYSIATVLHQQCSL